MGEHAAPPPARPRTGETPTSLPSTPASGTRRQRQAVGFTNRSRPSTASSASRGPAGDDSWVQQRESSSRPSTSNGDRPKFVTNHQIGRPGTSDSSGRARLYERPLLETRKLANFPSRNELFTRQQNTALSTSSFGTRTTTGTMTRPSTSDKPLQRRVREKILRQRLNLGPVLRQHAEGAYINPDGLKKALSQLPQPQLTNEELDFCGGYDDGPDSKILVMDFLESLAVPNYDDYDPWGKSRARETMHLHNRSRSVPTRQFSRPSFQVPKAQAFVAKHVVEAQDEEDTGPTDPTKPKAKAGAAIARKYLKQIGDEMDKKGVTLLDIFRKIDIDGSGAIDQGEFERAIDVIGVPGMERQQMTFLFRNIDENDNGKLDIHELQSALLDSQLTEAKESSGPSRPSTFRPDTGGGNAGPWAKAGNTRLAACLPQDHFNLRFRRSLVPPYATSETVVPMKNTFHFNPDHSRFSTVSLSNQWLIDGPGQGRDVKKAREEARIQRRRDVEARMRSLVESRERAVFDVDQARLGGLAGTRNRWINSLKAQ